jgi:hypothetical protein
MNYRNALYVVASIAVVAAPAALLPSCSGDQCDAAADHFAECLPEPEDTSSSSSSGGGGGRTPECSGQLLCEAKCVLDASCEALTQRDPCGLCCYLACIDPCQGLAAARDCSEFCGAEQCPKSQ